MRIARLSLYRLSLDLWSGESRYGRQQKLAAPLETNVVRLESDCGLVGWGEGCVPPPYYLPTLAAGAREAIAYLAPLVLGQAATRPRRVMQEIEQAVRGQGPAKTALDMALWDLCGKAQGIALMDLWGGRVADDLPVLAMVSVGDEQTTLDHLRAYRDAGYERFQIKIGEEGPAQDIAKIRAVMAELREGERCWFDVNRSWSLDDAMQVLPKVADLAPLIEQPCESYQECLTLSRRIGLGLMLDELIDGPEAMIRAVDDGILDVAVLKLSCTGGLTKQRFLAELGQRLGVPLRIEDYFGTGLTFAAVAQIAHSLPASATFGLYDYHLPELPLVTNPPSVRGGRVSLPDDCGPGLGVEVDQSLLGEPVGEWHL